MLYKFEDGLFVIYNCKHNYNWTNKNNIEELDVPIRVFYCFPSLFHA